jgi:hypothetical protein
LADLIHDEMPPSKIRSDAEPCLERALDERIQRELLKLIDQQRIGGASRCFGGGHDILTLGI